MRAVLRFDLNDEDDKAAFDSAMKGQTSEIIIDEIWNRCFRPATKHGFNDEVLDSEGSYAIVEKLGEIYNEVIEEYRE